MSTLERIAKMEGAMDRIRADLDESVLIQKKHEEALMGLAMDKARVVTGAWVANALTCFFVGIMLWFSQRAIANEAQLFREEIVRDVRNANAVQGPLRK